MNQRTQHVDLSDPVGGDGIYTTAELMDFIENGQSDTATLGASIDLGGEILEHHANPRQHYDPWKRLQHHGQRRLRDSLGRRLYAQVGRC